MQIWLDADAAPAIVKEIVFRSAIRLNLQTHVVSNRPIHIPKSPLIRPVVVNKGPDEADHYITNHAASGDVAITADVPLAEMLVKKDVRVINPRGQIYTSENIGELTASRNLMDQLRSTNQISGGGPPSYNDQDRNRFAQSLDKTLSALRKPKD